MKPLNFLFTFGLTTILTVSGVTLFSSTQKSSFFSSAIAQAAVRIQNNFVRLDMPQTGIQNDNWSCGPNSLSKLLRFYGHQVDYSQVRNISQRDKGIIPPRICVLGVCRDVSGLKTGFEPWELRDVMRRWEGNTARYERDYDLNRLKGLFESMVHFNH